MGWRGGGRRRDRAQALEDFAGVPTNDPNAVIVGTSPEHLHYEGLNEAVRILMESEDSQLIALNKARAGPPAWPQGMRPTVRRTRRRSHRRSKADVNPRPGWLCGAAMALCLRGSVRGSAMIAPPHSSGASIAIVAA